MTILSNDNHEIQFASARPVIQGNDRIPSSTDNEHDNDDADALFAQHVVKARPAWEATPYHLTPSFRDSAIQVSASNVMVDSSSFTTTTTTRSNRNEATGRHAMATPTARSPRTSTVLVTPLPPGDSRRSSLPTARATPIGYSTTMRRRLSTADNDFLALPQQRQQRRQRQRQRRVLPRPVQRFKERRVRNQAVAMITGGVIGGVLLGPLGAFLLGAVAHRTTKTIGRVQQARLERFVAAQQQQAAAGANLE